MRYSLYRNETGDPTLNAQRNLSGRTHYVDPDTLRWHKARIHSARPICNGLLFLVVESVQVTPPPSWGFKGRQRRGWRGVVFDLAGNAVVRCTLEDCASTREKAEKLVFAGVDKLGDPRKLNVAALKAQLAGIKREVEALTKTIKAVP